MDKARDFHRIRAAAHARGDRNLVLAMSAELERLGVTPEPLEVASGWETSVPAQMETVVGDRPRRGRPPKPRCEHGMLLDRCPDCKEEGL